MSQLTDIDELKSRLVASTQAQDRAEIILQLLRAHGKLNSAVTATQPYIDELEQIAVAEQKPVYSAWARLFTGHACYLHAHYNDALINYTEALELFKKVKNRNGAASAHNQLGTIYAYQGKISESLDHLFASLRIREELNDKNEMAATCNNLGVVFNDIGNYTRALDFHQKSVALREELGDKYGLMASYNNIGNLCSSNEHYDQALEYYQKSLNLQNEISDKKRMVACLNNIGIIYKNKGQYHKAIDYHLHARQIAQQQGYDEDIFIANVGIIKTCIAQQKYDTGNEYLQLVLKQKEQLEKLDFKLAVYELSGKILTAFKKYAEAENELKTGLELALAANNKAMQVEFYEHLYVLKKLEGDFAKALYYFEQAARVQKELASTDTAQKLGALKFESEIEQKEREKSAVENILYNILPKPIAQRIVSGESSIIEHFDSASVLFADFVGFTSWSTRMPLRELTRQLDVFFSGFDEIGQILGVEKIKTIGDAYMCVCGLPQADPYHAYNMANMAIAMLNKVKQIDTGTSLKLRIGIACGEVNAGVLSKNKYAYDLWGDTVNTASRMESHGLPDRIQITRAFKLLLEEQTAALGKTNMWKFEDRGEIDIKGKGQMRTYFLTAQ